MPRPPSPSPLSDEQIDQLRAELDAGRVPPVWFTPAAVGVDAGRSAKVVGLADPAEGDFIQVRPTGSSDVLSFSANELTMERPPRRRKAAEPAKAEKPARAARPVEPSTEELLVVRERPTRRPATPKPAEPATEAAPQPKRGRPAKPRQPNPVTVTLSGTVDGEWTVEVVTGAKRSARPQPVPASAVTQAARALGGDAEEAIDGVIAAAREQQRSKVEQLEAELEAARRALAELAESD